MPQAKIRICDLPIGAIIDASDGTKKWEPQLLQWTSQAKNGNSGSWTLHSLPRLTVVSELENFDVNDHVPRSESEMAYISSEPHGEAFCLKWRRCNAIEVFAPPFPANFTFQNSSGQTRLTKRMAFMAVKMIRSRNLQGTVIESFFSRFLIKEIHPELPPTEAYEWQYLAFCSLWYCGEQEDSLGVHVLLCFDVSQRIQGAISTGFRATQGADLRNSPFSLQIELAEIVVAQYDKALWTFRKPIRNIEKGRPNIPIRDDKERKGLIERYQLMHELSRHIIHCSETLAVASRTLLRIAQDHKISLQQNYQTSARVERALQFHANFLTCLQLRAQAFEQRLGNEIKLAFNVIAADDSNTAKDILKETRDDGRTSASVLEETKNDSKTSKEILNSMQQLLVQTRDDSKAFSFTVSLLTVLFLPGSFVSGFLGMNFFTFSVPDGKAEWHGADEVWVFFIITVPITVICLVLWIFSEFIDRWRRNIFKLLSKESGSGGLGDSTDATSSSSTDATSSSSTIAMPGQDNAVEMDRLDQNKENGRVSYNE